MTAGGPEHLRIILEGESLLNDASSFTLFTIFVEFVVRAAESSGGIQSSAGAIVWKIIWKMAWLATGESTGGRLGLSYRPCISLRCLCTLAGPFVPLL